MKRTATLIAIAAMLVAAPAAAAKRTTYSGDIATGGSVRFTVKTEMKNGKRKSEVTSFHFRRLAVTCAPGGSGTTSGNLDFDVPVKRTGKFVISAYQGDPMNPTAELRIVGKIANRNSNGTIRVHGSQIQLDGGGTGNCDSGTAHWSASK
jgi:hypothetical protein